MLRLYFALPWLWIAAGLAACVLLGEGISTLAHAPGGPGMGGAVLLAGVLAALFPVGLAFVFVGLVLLAGGRLVAQIVSLAALALCAMAVMAVPPLVMFLWVVALVPALTLWALRSDEVREWRARVEEERAARLRRIASGEETPRLARFVSLAWQTAGALILLGLPTAMALPASDNRDLFIFYEVLSLPLGVAIFVTGRRLANPTRRTLRWARIWAALLLLSTPMLWLSLDLKAASAVAFFAAASLWALGLDELRAMAGRREAEG